MNSDKASFLNFSYVQYHFSLYIIFVIQLNIYVYIVQLGGFPGGANGKEPACQCRRCKRCGFDPWVGKTPGGGHGNPFQYSCLENPMDRGAWWAIGSQRV